MYKRILLKLSGEALAGDEKTGINHQVISDVCEAIKKVHDMGVQIGIVVGGGNFWRGKNGEHMEQATAHYMGMLATVMNGLALQDEIEKHGMQARVQTAFQIGTIVEPFINRKALSHLEKNKIVIFAGGTGSPFFSTDTAAALRAVEMKADVILVAKTIDGVYDSDPKENKDAKKYDHITYNKILEDNLKVMDSTAIAMCRDNNMPLVVFAMNEPENIIKVVNGENIGTKID